MTTLNPFHENSGDNAGYVWKRVIWMLIIGGIALILICVDNSIDPEKGLPVPAKTDTTQHRTTVIKTSKGADSITTTSSTGKPAAGTVAPPSDRGPEETVGEEKPARSSDFMNYLSALGAAILIGGAAFAAGGIIGFLFGIPKIQQADAIAQSEAIIIQNDNLYVISDWITKIIVGVGLVQLKEIPQYLHRIGRALAPVLTADPDVTAVASGSVVCIILYFFSLGFFSLYLWTRLDYVLLLKKVNEKLRLIISVSRALKPDDGSSPDTPPTTPDGANPVAPVTPVMPPVVIPVAPVPPVNPADVPPAANPPA